MSLSVDDIQALAWASAALNDESSQDYDSILVRKMAAMSEVRHRMMDCEVDWDIMPKRVEEIDKEINSRLLPETSNERAYGIKSITHKKLIYTLDEACAKLVQVSASGQIIIQS